MNNIISWIDFLQEWGPAYLDGTLVTLKISFIGVLVGLILGILVAIPRMSKNKIAYGLSTAYVEIIRGTPLLVQVMIFYYGFASVIPENLDWMKNAFVLSTAAVCINSSAYISEIIRGGIQSVDRGQMEAARSLGMTESQAMKKIILPQAIKIVLPALGNEFVTLIKESAIVSFVGIQDITFQAKVSSGATYRFFTPFITAAVIYFVLVFTLSKILNVYERRLKASDRG